MTWQCFLAERTDTAAQTLRRFTFSDSSGGGRCPGGRGSHDAEVRIEDMAFVSENEGSGGDDFPHDDPRWPTTCAACGYVFKPEDEWQHNVSRLYARPGTSERFTLREAPIGAMWYVPWMLHARPTPEDIAAGKTGYLSEFYWRDWADKRPPIEVRCPGRYAGWLIDSKANNGPGWEITGEPPLLTATPSIMTPTYHGWLRGGVLTDDIEGRTYA